MTEPRRYRVLASLGRGLVGTVYVAEMIGEGGFSKVVALKMYDGSVDAIGEILRQEVLRAARIRHRAVVQTYGLLRLDGHWTVAMEYVDGMSIEQLARREVTLPAGAAVEMVREVASALHVAHSAVGGDGSPAAMTHGDVKAANIKITESGGVKLLDLGIARSEILAGRGGGGDAPRAPGPEGDVYGLGCATVRALTGGVVGPVAGDAAAHGATITQALRMIEEAVGVQAFRLNPMVAAMLAHDPAARPTARAIEDMCARIRSELHGPSLRDWAEREIHALAEERTAPRDLPAAILIETPIAAPSDRGSRSLPRLALVGLGAGVLVAAFAVTGVTLLAARSAHMEPSARTSVVVTGDAEGVSLAKGASVFALPARVPPGRYSVEASFAPGKRIGAGTVEIPAGDEVALHCETQLRSCALEPSPD